MKTLEALNAIAQVIYNKKGLNILALDVRGFSSLTDFLLIAEGNVDRHVSAIARAIHNEMKAVNGPELLRTEGLKEGDWVVLDFGEIMVHLFKPNLRERYALERLWGDSKVVDLEIDTSKPAMGDGS